jgi:peptidoglycan/LPS O-acetylase OafA/YrhL
MRGKRDSEQLKPGPPTLRSFADRYAEVGGFGPGFDAVRLFLCYEVLVWHAWTVGAGSSAPGKASPVWMAFEAMVPMFFALSGFLVAGSAQRLPVGQFLLSRALRILPALAFVVGLTALIIGPLMTDRRGPAYFLDPRFTSYFLNIIGVVRYELPGVFMESQLGAAVNGSLWTVPWEIGCYFVMASFMVAGLAGRAWLFATVGLAWVLAAVGYEHLFPSEMPGTIHKLLRFGLTSPGALLIPYFLTGAALHFARARIPWNGWIAAAMAAVLVAGSLLLDGTTWSRTALVALLGLYPCVYLVAYLGLHHLPRPPGFRGGDYSYGIYLCHFPLLQAFHVAFGFQHWGLLLAVALPPATLFAMASWHLIESPMLAQRKRLSLLGQRLAARVRPAP